ITNTLSSCTASSSVNILIHPLVQIMLGKDTAVCNNVNFFLDAGNPGSSYLWLGGQTSQTIAVSSSGIYGVAVTNTGGCSANAFITMTLVSAPALSAGISTRYLCGGRPLMLEASSTGQISWGAGN